MTSAKREFWSAKVLYPSMGIVLLGSLVAIARCPMSYPRAAEFSLPVVSSDGHPGPDRMSLADQRGHVVLLDFWATWCGPCARETPVLSHLAQRFHDRGFVVLGVNMDEGGPASVPAFMRQFGGTYPVVYDDSNVNERYEVHGLPTVVLIDRQGRIRRVHTGTTEEGDLADEIRELL